MAEANGNKLLINSAGRDAFRLVGVEHKINDGGRTGRVGFYSVGTSLNGVEAESFAATDLFVATFKVLKTGEITITAYEDSYQGENNENVDSVTITATEKPAGLKGDVDLDGEVATLDDVTVLARHYMNYELIEDQQAFANGDIDGDGEITLDDFTALVRYYMGYDETLG